MKKLPIGISDFKKIIENDDYYIDKSLLIKDILDIGSEVILIPRPRRFGKTLNISMLKYFFEKSETDEKHLFQNLSIWKQGENYIDHQGQYPVIFMTFKDVNSQNWEVCFSYLKGIIANEYSRHDYLLSSSVMNEEEKGIYKKIIQQTAYEAQYGAALKNLSFYLSKYHGKKVFILIDEYDTPIQQGFLNGYYDSIISFMRNLLSGAFKDNTYLKKGILTGILRVAKESIFSGLNNFKVYSILKDEFSTYFGLLEDEVDELLQYYQISFEMEDIKNWYNGYNFGGHVIYNPWSILNFAQDYKEGLIPHWLNTSSNALSKNLIISGGHYFKDDIERLIKGDSIEKIIDDNIVFSDLEQNSDVVWSLLLFTGYLKVISKRLKDEEWVCELKIPNQEVRHFYKKTINEWFKGSIKREKLQPMLQSLVSGDITTFEYYFKYFVLTSMSYFDPTGEEPERVYQAFVLGLLVHLNEDYYVKSNRESGLGRYDLALIPRDTTLHKKGIIFEFKKADPIIKETIEEALIKAEEQIKKKKYDMELIDAGVAEEDIIKIVVVFQGKDLVMKW